jgi:hypothetical protein
LLNALSLFGVTEHGKSGRLWILCRKLKAM